jgi:hypothetical protein
MMPQADVMAPYVQKDLGVEQCPAPDGWRVLLVSSDSNSWIDVAGPEVTWPGERPIVYEAPIGNFPSVGVPPTLEWRRTGDGQTTALIVPVTAQNRETFKTDQTAFYVVRFQSGRACVIGRPRTLEEARAMADSSKGC